MKRPKLVIPPPPNWIMLFLIGMFVVAWAVRTAQSIVEASATPVLH